MHFKRFSTLSASLISGDFSNSLTPAPSAPAGGEGTGSVGDERRRVVAEAADGCELVPPVEGAEGAHGEQPVFVGAGREQRDDRFVVELGKRRARCGTLDAHDAARSRSGRIRSGRRRSRAATRPAPAHPPAVARFARSGRRSNPTSRTSWRSGRSRRRGGPRSGCRCRSCRSLREQDPAERRELAGPFGALLERLDELHAL